MTLSRLFFTFYYLYFIENSFILSLATVTCVSLINVLGITQFTPAINYYLREELNYKTDIKYNMFGNVRPWDRTGNKTGEGLRSPMEKTSYLQVMIQSGYFDGATTLMLNILCGS